jgi:hypothetical protein
MTAAVTAPAQALLATFEAAATAAGAAETAIRKRAEAEIAAAERERAFAYRRLNLMRTLIRATAAAETEEEAAGRGVAAVRAQLGWDADSATRVETLGRFSPVVRAVFAGLAPTEDGKTRTADVAGTLTDFEAWYERTYGLSFWRLFEQEIAELPLVER